MTDWIRYFGQFWFSCYPWAIDARADIKPFGVLCVVIVTVILLAAWLT